MKPKNDRQREVVALSAALPPITEAQKRWAFGHCFSKKAYLCKGKAWCLLCGGIIDAPETSPLGAALGIETIVCPHCGQKLKVEQCKKQTSKETWIFTMLQVRRGYQVCRNFEVTKQIIKGGRPFYYIGEIVQNWITEDGHEEVVARQINNVCYCDKWDTSKPMQLRDANRRDLRRPDKYHLGGAWIYPARRVLPQAKRNGYTGRNQSGIPEGEHIKLLLTDREAEMLEKNGQYSLLSWKWARGFQEFSMPYAHAIRVANRAKYKVRDASMWYDYLHLLSYFNLDTHNAHYVCPADLKEAHDRLHRRKERIEALKAAEKRRKEAAGYEADYKARYGQYLGISFGDERITVTVLQSVAEFAEEGKAMHHCVFGAKYFTKKDTLILSAKDTEGKRLATIELNLKTLQVVQCRGKYNAKPEQYDAIMNLVSRNAALFAQAAQKKQERV